jgi:hypothetical protein
MYYKRNKTRSRNHCYRGKAISITYSLALVIQHAMRMRRIILSSVACPAVPHFPHYLIKGTIFEEKKSYGT